MKLSGITTDKKQRTNCIKVELKDKEGIRKVNQIEGESPLNLLLFLQKRL
jgi:hypothetical protein